MASARSSRNGTLKELNRLLISDGRRSLWTRSIQTLDQMQASQIQADAFTCSSAISSCEKGAWQIALHCFGSLCRSVLPNAVVYTTLMVAFSRYGEWRQALDLFRVAEHAHTDIVLYGAAVKACEEGSQWQEAICILQSLPDRALVPDTTLVNSAISACEKAEEWPWALHLLRTLSDWVLRADAISFSAAISACEKAMQWQQALLVLGDVEHSLLELDIILCNAALSSCAKGAWTWSLHLLASLEQRALAASQITFNAATAAAAASPWQLAWCLLPSFTSHTLRTDVIAYNAVVSGVGGEWPVACQLLCKIEEVLLNSSVVSYTAALEAFATPDDVVSPCVAAEKQRIAEEFLHARIRLQLVCFVMAPQLILPRDAAELRRACAADSGEGGRVSTGESEMRDFEQSSPPDPVECSICLEGDANVLLPCGHRYHAECLDRWFETRQVCPTCGRAYGDTVGTMPDGVMSWHFRKQRLAGYSCPTVVLHFFFPRGTVDGEEFEGRSQHAYLPDDEEGRSLLALFQLAFRRRLLFGLRPSLTTGRLRPTFSIHMKTSMSGGPARHGYPDPQYYRSALEELRLAGVEIDAALPVAVSLHRSSYGCARCGRNAVAVLNHLIYPVTPLACFFALAATGEGRMAVLAAISVEAGLTLPAFPSTLGFLLWILLTTIAYTSLDLVCMLATGIANLYVVLRLLLQHRYSCFDTVANRARSWVSNRLFQLGLLNLVILYSGIWQYTLARFLWQELRALSWCSSCGELGTEALHGSRTP
ncbi:Dtx3l [Symbiodinium necroappetens]|uniref:RING-type E3 ubiquitin transferase n=1 Tax=Symbiodinium necroappetens TaxID=1628268 RepID=A0A812J4V0_9DINO|nr:Dtx3l [Symbiodinium necroappetens]